MSLRRTPPPVRPAPAAATDEMPITRTFDLSQTRQHCTSEPDLNVTRSAEELVREASNITQRFKRKRECTDEQLSGFMTEMKTMFLEFRAHQDSQDTKMEKISLAMDEIKVLNLAMQNSVDFVANKFDSIQTQIDKLEADRNQNLQYIQMLEDKFENLERHKRATCVEIKNIPHTTGENKMALLNQLTPIANILNTPIDPHYVKDIFRINTRDPANKTIIVDFTSVLTKERLIRNYKEYNKANKTSKLSTETLHISGPHKPVFISENLSPQMKRLFYLTKEYAKTNAFQYSWVSNGRIFMRKQEGSGAIPIRSEQDLGNLDIPNTNNVN